MVNIPELKRILENGAHVTEHDPSFGDLVWYYKFENGKYYIQSSDEGPDSWSILKEEFETLIHPESTISYDYSNIVINDIKKAIK